MNMASADGRSLLNDFVDTGRSDRPRFFGTRFDENGAFLPERGNTIVNHLISGSRTEQALVEVRRRLMDLPFAHHFSFTPVSSLHMTVAQGVIDNRRKEHFWPQDMALDADVDDVTRTYLERLADFDSRGSFAVAADEMTPLGLTLKGATPEDERILRRWRDDLIPVFGYRQPGHDDYRFHITLAYLIDWLPPEAVEVYEKALADCLDDVLKQAPVLELDEMAFCSFDDMNHFEPLLVLR